MWQAPWTPPPLRERQMLRKILADKIELEAVGSGRKRGYRFRGALAIERLIGGEALQRRCKLACLWWPQGDLTG